MSLALYTEVAVCLWQTGILNFSQISLFNWEEERLSKIWLMATLYQKWDFFKGIWLMSLASQPGKQKFLDGKFQNGKTAFKMQLVSFYSFGFQSKFQWKYLALKIWFQNIILFQHPNLFFFLIFQELLISKFLMENAKLLLGPDTLMLKFGFNIMGYLFDKKSFLMKSMDELSSGHRLSFQGLVCLPQLSASQF